MIGKPFIVTPPTGEVVSLAEIKDHMRVTTTLDDDLIGILLSTATESVERVLNRSLLTQTRELYFDKFPREIVLFAPPVQLVTHIKYYDRDNILQTIPLDTCDVDLISRKPRIKPLPNYFWPTTKERYNAVVVRYVAGWATAGEVRQEIRQAIRLTVATWYENRESMIVGNRGYELPKHVGLQAMLAHQKVH